MGTDWAKEREKIYLKNAVSGCILRLNRSIVAVGELQGRLSYVLGGSLDGSAAGTRRTSSNAANELQAAQASFQEAYAHLSNVSTDDGEDD